MPCPVLYGSGEPHGAVSVRVAGPPGCCLHIGVKHDESQDTDGLTEAVVAAGILIGAPAVAHSVGPSQLPVLSALAATAVSAEPSPEAKVIQFNETAYQSLFGATMPQGGVDYLLTRHLTTDDVALFVPVTTSDERQFSIQVLAVQELKALDPNPDGYRLSCIIGVAVGEQSVPFGGWLASSATRHELVLLSPVSAAAVASFDHYNQVGATGISCPAELPPREKCLCEAERAYRRCMEDALTNWRNCEQSAAGTYLGCIALCCITSFGLGFIPCTIACGVIAIAESLICLNNCHEQAETCEKRYQEDIADCPQ